MTLPTITAPDGLPDFLADSHGIEEDSVYAQVPFTTGHSRARRLWTVPERVVSVSWLLDADKLALVDDWHNNILLAGARQFAARVRNQGAGATVLWWAARWIDFQIQMLGKMRRNGALVEFGRVSGRLLLTGEGSETRPDTGALAMEVLIALIDARSSVSGSAALAMEVDIALLGVGSP